MNWSLRPLSGILYIYVNISFYTFSHMYFFNRVVDHLDCGFTTWLALKVLGFVWNDAVASSVAPFIFTGRLSLRSITSDCICICAWTVVGSLISQYLALLRSFWIVALSWAFAATGDTSLRTKTVIRLLDTEVNYLFLVRFEWTNILCLFVFHRNVIITVADWIQWSAKQVDIHRASFCELKATY